MFVAGSFAPADDSRMGMFFFGMVPFIVAAAVVSTAAFGRLIGACRSVPGSLSYMICSVAFILVLTSVAPVGYLVKMFCFP
jgi:hypothetical protein